MTKRPRLALAIPTYRRAAIVAENLTRMVDEARALGVAIYISDDSPDDDTAAVVAAAACDFPDLHYRRNNPALGHDANLVTTLCWPDADYVWLIGDALWVKPGCLTRIVRFLDDQDMLFVRVHSDDARMIEAVTGKDAHALIQSSLWHQTLTGATIYHRRVRDWARAQGDALVIKRNFPHLSVTLGYASTHRVTVGWFGEPSIGSGNKQSYWRARAISVFVEDWSALVAAFPAVIPPAARAGIIRSHSARMNLFDARTLLELKPSGEFGWSSLRKPYFLDAMHLASWKIIAMLALPASAIRWAKRLPFPR